MDDFKTIKEHAWSLAPNEDISGLKLIFVEETKHGTFKYFEDANTGEYRYQSSGTEEFHKWIKEREKERKDVRKNKKSNHKEN